MKGFEPVNIDKLNFLDITNDGLIIGQSPNGNMKEFIDYARNKAEKLLREHDELFDDDPLEVFCSIWSQEN